VLLLSLAFSRHHFGSRVNLQTILSVSDLTSSQETVCSVTFKEFDSTNWQLGEEKLISWLRRQKQQFVCFRNLRWISDTVSELVFSTTTTTTH